LRTDFGLIKFRKEEKQIDYLDKYNELINQFKNDSFLYSFLKEITLVNHDFTDKINSNNFKVHIMTNMNNKYIYPTIVSINSVLKNSNKKNITIVYHILYPEDLRRGNINKVKSLLYNYPNNLELIFYNMGNLFSTFKRTRFSEVTFFRLLAPLFIPEERIIYLDSDVLAFEDLSEMYQLDMNDNYIYGFLDLLSNGIDYLGLKSDKYVNAGVLLINLDLIRKNKKYKELLSMKIYNKKLNNNDQTIIASMSEINPKKAKYALF
jgi:lipopolysaccharide biosynthesis glycosyltransferase